MSLQGMMSGSDCAVGANPLSQVLKHAEGDRSLQQDRTAGPSTSRLHHFPGTSAAPAHERDLALARQFFEANGRTAQPGPSFGMPHQLPENELARMAEMNRRGGPRLNEAWVMEQQNHIRTFEESKAQATWATEFNSAPQIISPGAAMQQQQQSPAFQQTSYSSPMYTSRMPMTGMYQPINQSQDVAVDKGKGREADFEAAFAQVTASLAPVQATSNINNLESTLENAHLEDATDFKTVWETLQDSDAPPPEQDLAKWEAEYNALMAAQRDQTEGDYGDAMQKAWESSFVDNDQPKFNDEGIPLLEPYVFEQNNKYLASTESALDHAKALLQRNGSLSEAALLLEAAIQKGELGKGGYEAWILLGETRNMDEREIPGMRALTEGVRLATAAGAVGEGMLSLAISYTNEAFDRGSYTMLLRWIHARFPDHPIPEETARSLSKNSTWDTHQRVTDVFLDLARSQNAQGILDPDVQIGLGVLFYTNADYDHAKDCFQSALSMRPNDYLLWNRLGSSLSNGNKPEQALGAYQQALQIRPTYTRAIYNVGVACLNIGAHKEAAEHFLGALVMQDTNGGETSDQLWTTLSRAFLTMNRPDLAELAKGEPRPSLDVFRKDFEF